MEADKYDVIVIGGGPAGTAAAHELVSRGLKVLLLEKAVHPRPHIGESMLPYTTKLLEKMGVLPDMNGSDFVKKEGAEFTGVTGEHRRVSFSAQGKDRIDYAFQVERSIFDNLLLKHAERKGVIVKENARVVEVLEIGDRVVGVRYSQNEKIYTIYAEYVLDCSGRAGVISNKYRLRVRNVKLNMVAVYKYFQGVDEKVNPGMYGDIQIGNHSDGWVWAIPIHDDVLSIGAVTSSQNIRGFDAESVFSKYVGRIPRIVKRLEGAQDKGKATVEGDFCYHTEQFTGPGYLLAGDAACFVDPVFSGGIYLSLCTGIAAAQGIADILKKNMAEKDALRRYEDFAKTGYDCYFRLIYAFYESNFNLGHSLSLMPIKIDPKWLSRFLSGDFWSMENPLTTWLRTQKKWDTFKEINFFYGCPVYGEIEDVDTVKITEATV